MRATCYKPDKEMWDEVWAGAVLKTAWFPDTRLHRRAVLFLSQQAKRPGDGILRGAETSAAAKANYRFVENRRVMPEHLWDPIHEYGATKLRGVGRALCIQDTSTLMFQRLLATTGLGTVDTEREEALWMHSTLAVRPDGEVLGLLANDVWSRPASEFGKAKKRKVLPIEAKESFKWIRGIRAARDARDRHSPETRLVHVFDREGDVHEVLAEVVDGRDDAVIRCGRDRKVAGPYAHIRATLAAQPVLGRFKIKVPRQRGQRARSAAVTVRSAAVTITPSQAYSGREPVRINAVWVHESDPPLGVEPLDWVLLTTLPVATVAACNEVIALYKLRWLIEDFHLTLKSGCGVEKTQLKTAKRIEELLAVLCAVAVRVLALRQKSRTDPDAPCTEMLDADEWRVLWIQTHDRRLPDGQQPPTIREAVQMIGRLGGHLGRKRDGMPGVRTLWRGWRDLHLLVLGYRAAQR